jgi:predicted nucleotidyltransferase
MTPRSTSYGGLIMNSRISIPKDAIAAFCRERGIRRLAVFGSALRPDFRSDSDIDLLVEFEPDRTPGLFGIARMERELSALLEGRKVDLRTPEDLSRYFRRRVLEEAEVQYVKG